VGAFMDKLKVFYDWIIEETAETGIRYGLDERSPWGYGRDRRIDRNQMSIQQISPEWAEDSILRYDPTMGATWEFLMENLDMEDLHNFQQMIFNEAIIEIQEFLYYQRKKEKREESSPSKQDLQHDLQQKYNQIISDLKQKYNPYNSKTSKWKRVIAATPELIQEMIDKFYDLEQVIVESYVQQKNKSITVNPTNLQYWEKADIVSDLVTDKRLLSNDLFDLEDEVHNFADSFVKRYNIKDQQVVKEKFIEAVEEEIYGIIDRYSRDIYDAIYEDAKRVGKTIASYFMDFDPAEVKSWPIAARLDEIKNIEEGHSNLLEYANMWDFDEVYSFYSVAKVLEEASLNSGYEDWSEGLDEGFWSNISVRKMEDSLGADVRHLYEPVDPSREPSLGPEETDENEAKKHRRDIADKWKVDYDRSRRDRLNWATEEDFPKRPWDVTSGFKKKADLSPELIELAKQIAKNIVPHPIDYMTAQEDSIGRSVIPEYRSIILAQETKWANAVDLATESMDEGLWYNFKDLIESSYLDEDLKQEIEQNEGEFTDEVFEQVEPFVDKVWQETIDHYVDEISSTYDDIIFEAINRLNSDIEEWWGEDKTEVEKRVGEFIAGNINSFDLIRSLTVYAEQELEWLEDLNPVFEEVKENVLKLADAYIEEKIPDLVQYTSETSQAVNQMYEPVDPSQEPYLGPEETDENEAKKHRKNIKDKWKIQTERRSDQPLNWATEEDFPKKPWDFTSKWKIAGINENVWYHVTPVRNIQSIRDHGLSPRQNLGQESNFEGLPVSAKGVYLWPNISSATWYANNSPLTERTGVKDDQMAILRIKNIDKRKLLPDHEDLTRFLEDYHYDNEDLPDYIPDSMIDDSYERGEIDVEDTMKKLEKIPFSQRQQLTNRWDESMPFMYMSTIPAQNIDVMKVIGGESEKGFDANRYEELGGKHLDEEIDDQYGNLFKYRPMFGKWKIAGGFEDYEDLYTQYYNQLEQNENQTKQLIEKYAFDAILGVWGGADLAVERNPKSREVMPNQLRMRWLHDSWLDFTNHQKLLELLFPDWKKSNYSSTETRIRIIAIEEFINNKMPDLLQKMEGMYNYIAQGRLSGESDDEIRVGYEKHFQTKVSAMSNQFLPRLYNTMIENLKRTATFDWEADSNAWNKVKVAYEILNDWDDYVQEIKEDSGYKGENFNLSALMRDVFIEIFTPIWETISYLPPQEQSNWVNLHSNIASTYPSIPYEIDAKLFKIHTETMHDKKESEHPKWSPSQIVDFYKEKSPETERDYEDLRKNQILDKWKPEEWWKDSKWKKVSADEDEEELRTFDELTWEVSQEVANTANLPVEAESIVLDQTDLWQLTEHFLFPLRRIISEEDMIKAADFFQSQYNNVNELTRIFVDQNDFYFRLVDDLTNIIIDRFDWGSVVTDEEWYAYSDDLEEYLYQEAKEAALSVASNELDDVLVEQIEVFLRDGPDYIFDIYQQQKVKLDRKINLDQEMMDVYDVKGELPSILQPVSPQVAEWMRQQSKVAGIEDWSTPETGILMDEINQDSRILKPAIKTMEKIVRNGGTSEDLAAWLIENILTPYNEHIGNQWEQTSDEQDVEAQKNELRKTWKQQARKQFPFSLEKQKQYVKEMEQTQFGLLGDPEPEDIENYLLKVENINWQEIYDWIREDLQYRGKMASSSEEETPERRKDPSTEYRHKLLNLFVACANHGRSDAFRSLALYGAAMGMRLVDTNEMVETRDFRLNENQLKIWPEVVKPDLEKDFSNLEKAELLSNYAIGIVIGSPEFDNFIRSLPNGDNIQIDEYLDEAMNGAYLIGWETALKNIPFAESIPEIGNLLMEKFSTHGQRQMAIGDEVAETHFEGVPEDPEPEPEEKEINGKKWKIVRPKPNKQPADYAKPKSGWGFYSRHKKSESEEWIDRVTDSTRRKIEEILTEIPTKLTVAAKVNANQLVRSWVWRSLRDDIQVNYNPDTKKWIDHDGSEYWLDEYDKKMIHFHNTEKSRLINKKQMNLGLEQVKNMADVAIQRNDPFQRELYWEIEDLISLYFPDMGGLEQKSFLKEIARLLTPTEMRELESIYNDAYYEEWERAFNHEVSKLESMEGMYNYMRPKTAANKKDSWEAVLDGEMGHDILTTGTWEEVKKQTLKWLKQLKDGYINKENPHDNEKIDPEAKEQDQHAIEDLKLYEEKKRWSFHFDHGKHPYDLIIQPVGYKESNSFYNDYDQKTASEVLMSV
jgi:hypothetical protein